MNEEAGVMDLDQSHADALDEAETWLFHSDFCPYLELKALLKDSDPSARARFRLLFIKFYALNTGGLTEEFKEAFFEILFNGEVLVGGRPDFPSLFGRLSEIKRKKGDYAMPFSFVSKLVASRYEGSPIYDRHVLAFFGERAPATSAGKAKRIEWFVTFLKRIEQSYRAWAEDPRIAPVLARLKKRDTRLAECDDVRLIDFLVWKVGNRQLLHSRVPQSLPAQ